jgi:hypothetical protein
MIELLLHWLASLVKSRRRLEAENLVLRHQVNILRRSASRRLWLSNADRLAFALLSGLSRARPEGARSPRRNGASNGRMGCSADDRGLAMAHRAKISGTRSRCRLWPRREAMAAYAGDPGSTNGAAVASAKHLRGAFDRVGKA